MTLCTGSTGTFFHLVAESPYVTFYPITCLSITLHSHTWLIYTYKMQANGIILTPALAPLDLAHLCTRYLLARFRSELGQRSSESIAITTVPLIPPIMLPVSLTMELDCIAKSLADAFLNRGQ